LVRWQPAHGAKREKIRWGYVYFSKILLAVCDCPKKAKKGTWLEQGQKGSGTERAYHLLCPGLNNLHAYFRLFFALCLPLFFDFPA
jgi:hypothetical protein